MIAPRSGAQHIGVAIVETRKDQVQVADHLVRQRHPGEDFAASMSDPGRLGGQGVASYRRRPPAAPDHQFGHRPHITGVALQPSQQLLGAGLFHRGRVQLDHLEPADPQSSDQRPVIVTGRLDPDPDYLCCALGFSTGDRPRQGGESGLGEGELKGGGHYFAVVIGDQRHGLRLAHVDGDHQATPEISTPDPGHELSLQTTTNMCHIANFLSDERQLSNSPCVSQHLEWGT
jgi:hypothetical protein